MKNYFIYNPIAGNYPQHKREALLKLISSNSENIIFETRNKSDEIQLTERAIREGAKKIIAIGGDGTINKVASVLTGTDIPLGLIPMGSGNGLARHLKIPMNSVNALNKALNGNPIKIDVCKVNDQLFFCTAGIGFDAAVAYTFDSRSKRGLLNYMIAVLISLFKYKPIEIELGSGRSEKLFLLTVANANQYGNNAFISPLSNIQDGQFEIIKIKKNNLFILLFISIRLFLKNIHKSSGVEVLYSNSFRIIYKADQPIHLDGESVKLENHALQFNIMPGALNVIL